MYRAKTQFSVPCLISAMQCYYVRSTVSKDIKVVVPTYEITTLEESKSMRTKLTDSEKPIRTRVYDKILNPIQLSRHKETLVLLII